MQALQKLSGVSICNGVSEMKFKKQDYFIFLSLFACAFLYIFSDCF